MTLLGDVILWSALPVAVLLLAAAVGGCWLWRRGPFPTESSQVRVADAYLAAKNQATEGVHAA